ncbi:MAG: hypothetical protein WCL28_09945 [bacterium]
MRLLVTNQVAVAEEEKNVTAVAQLTVADIKRDVAGPELLIMATHLPPATLLSNSYSLTPATVFSSSSNNHFATRTKQLAQIFISEKGKPIKNPGKIRLISALLDKLIQKTGRPNQNSVIK